MLCPVCRQDQVIVEYEGIELDLCLDGHGIWFDADELRQLFEAAGAPALHQDLEQRLEALPGEQEGPRRRCPRCRAKMDHRAAPGRDGPVILDVCPRGHGLWFDGGELEQVLGAELGGDDPALGRVHEFLARFSPPEDKEQAED